jgi:hypothetical protein
VEGWGKNKDGPNIMKTSQKNSAVLIFITLASVVFGCRLGQDQEINPTLPAYHSETSPSTSANFYAMRSKEEDFCVYIRSGEFRFDVLPGEYLLTYRTNLGEFKYVLRALEKALVTIGIPSDDVVHDAVLYTGIITNTAIRMMQSVSVSGPVTLATWPGIEQDAIVLDPTVAPIHLILDGLVNPERAMCAIPSNPSSTPSQEPPASEPPAITLPDLNVTLTWEEAVNLTLLVLESSGGWASEGHNGLTALSTGDNMCGFGALCLPEACMSELTCNEPENVYVPYSEAITGFYTANVELVSPSSPIDNRCQGAYS